MPICAKVRRDSKPLRKEGSEMAGRKPQAHEKESIATALIHFANTREHGAPNVYVLKASKQQYIAIYRAAREHGAIPVNVRMFRGIVALGESDSVANLKTQDVSARMALQIRLTALGALLPVLDTWSIDHGLGDAMRAPSTYSRRETRTPSAWRDSQPFETDLIIRNRALDSIPEEWKRRATWIPTDSELDALQIPGV
jgi:hypothetical protein